MDQDEVEGYKWETAYAEGLNIRSVLQENEEGSIEDSIRQIVLNAKRKRRLAEKPSKIRLGNVSLNLDLIVYLSLAHIPQL